MSGEGKHKWDSDLAHLVLVCILTMGTGLEQEPSPERGGWERVGRSEGGGCVHVVDTRPTFILKQLQGSNPFIHCHQSSCGLWSCMCL